MSATTTGTALPVSSQKLNVFPRGQAVFGICALVILLLLFNFYPQRIGFWISATDDLSFVPILSPAFFDQYLPWINLCWVLALGLNIAHLSLGRWTLATRLIDLALAFLALNVVVSMIFGPASFAVNAQTASLDTTVQVVTFALSMVTPFVLGVIVLALVIDMIKKVIALVRSLTH